MNTLANTHPLYPGDASCGLFCFRKLFRHFFPFSSPAQTGLIGYFYPTTPLEHPVSILVHPEEMKIRWSRTVKQINKKQLIANDENGGKQKNEMSANGDGITQQKHKPEKKTRIYIEKTKTKRRIEKPGGGRRSPGMSQKKKRTKQCRQRQTDARKQDETNVVGFFTSRGCRK